MKKRDWILLGSIAIVLIVVCAVFYIIINKEKGNYVEITYDGDVVETFSLEEDIEYRYEKGDAYNIIVIKEGKVQVTEASCPDKVCVHEWKIENLGESIICLPNKLVIRIKGDAAEDLDGVAG